MTTHATATKIIRRDTTVEGYTDHDVDLVIGGVTYRASAGYTSGAIERTSDLSAGTSEIVGIIDNVNLSESDLRAGVYDGARVEIRLVDWKTETVVAVLLVGHLGLVEIVDGEYRATLDSIESELRKPIGRIFGLRCDADLGDSRCGVTLSADSGTVATVTTARRVFSDTGRTEADGHYDGGKVTWLTGANAGRVMDVKKYTLSSQTIELFEPMPSDIAASDTYTVTRGCDKTFETCRDTFSNVVNFRGYPYIPGVSDILSGQTGTG